MRSPRHRITFGLPGGQTFLIVSHVREAHLFQSLDCKSTSYANPAVGNDGRLLVDDVVENFHLQPAPGYRQMLRRVDAGRLGLAGGAHIHGNHEGRLLADMDSNGWPQSGRARALQELRRCYAFHIAGDQHLATVIHHGINNWEDSNWSFCVPSIVNFYGRWWWPLEERQRDSPFRADLPFTGRFYDGFHNQVTMHAYANPTEENHNAAGYGIVRFKKSTREITMECWPRHVDVSSSEAQQFPGWPITIKQTDNYARQPMGYLPKLKIHVDDAVVQVFDSDLEEPVYTLRIKGREFQPPVFRAGSYTVRISKGVETRELLDVRSTPEMSERMIDVDF